MTPPQPTGLLNRNVICLWPLREVLLLSPATIPFRVTCRWSKPDGLAATVQTLVSAASRVLISISSTKSVLLASNRTLPVVGHLITVATTAGHQFARTSSNYFWCRPLSSRQKSLKRCGTNDVQRVVRPSSSKYGGPPRLSSDKKRSGSIGRWQHFVTRGSEPARMRGVRACLSARERRAFYHRRLHVPRQPVARRKINSNTTAPMKALIVNATIPLPK